MLNKNCLPVNAEIDAPVRLKGCSIDLMDGRPVSALAELSPLRYHVATKRASPPPAGPPSPRSPEASWGSLFIRRRPRLTPIVPFHPRGNLPDANLRP
ncbi:hypothetical protein PUN28_014963 [Cardiocondyla obscurior]|uniref:Uncharacterized protein n=1 Tax=Cardiocondyla obscurior TaxID=286306 RepID=A0AAW2EWC3_9HYME